MSSLFIKNMVCARCIKSVKEIFLQNEADILSVQLGVVELKKPLSRQQESKVVIALKQEGFELLDDQKSKLVQKVKQHIIDLVHYSDLDELKEKLSVYLSRKIHKDYNYLSNLFSSVEGVTIEQFFILQKIEKVKELLVYDELSLSEISFKLGYSSVAHLSGQFKKVTGFTPSQFKKLKVQHRKQLDKL